MNTHSTIIEKAFNAAHTALGTSPDYPKPVADAFKRRDAAADLLDLKPLNVAHELQASPNVRQWPSVLDKCAAHNARAEQAQAAIKGGILTSATAQLDRALKQYVPEYADQAHETVSGILAALTDAAAHVASLNAENAVRNGYGDQLTELHKHTVKVRTHTAVGSTVAPAQKVAQAAQALALITVPGRIDPIKKTPATRWNQGGETRSNAADLARRDEARRLMTDWHRDETETLRKLARGEYAGFELSAATSDDYAHRVTQFENADRIEVVAD